MLLIDVLAASDLWRLCAADLEELYGFSTRASLFPAFDCCGGLALVHSCSKLSQETLNTAIASILQASQEKKRKFVETIELQISGPTLLYLFYRKRYCELGSSSLTCRLLLRPLGDRLFAVYVHAQVLRTTTLRGTNVSLAPFAFLMCLAPSRRYLSPQCHQHAVPGCLHTIFAF